MLSINKKCHQNEFLSIVQIMPGWLLLVQIPAWSVSSLAFYHNTNKGPSLYKMDFNVSVGKEKISILHGVMNVQE